MDEFEKINETPENEEVKEEIKEEINAEVAEPEEKEALNETESENVSETEEIAETEEILATETVAEDDDVPETPDVTDDDGDAANEPDALENDSFETITPLTDEQLFDAVEQKPVKKKRVLHRAIIIAASILVATLVVFGCVVLVRNIMTPSLEGIWRLDKTYTKGSEKEAQKMGTSAKEAVYYQLTPDGDFIFTSGTVTQKMKWTYADSKGKETDKQTKTILMYPKDNKDYGTQFNWSCEGNAFSDKKLKLTTGTDTVQVHELSSYNGSEIPQYKMPLDKNFKAVENVIGKWSDKATKQDLVFNKDGSYSLTVSGYLTQTGNYSVDAKKKTITLKYVGNGADADTGALPYTVKDKTLTIANYEFTKSK